MKNKKGIGKYDGLLLCSFEFSVKKKKDRKK